MSIAVAVPVVPLSGISLCPNLAGSMLSPMPEMVPKNISHLTAELGPRNSCTEFLNGFFSGPAPSREAVVWLLRHFALLATVRDSSTLMAGIIKVAQTCQITVASVVMHLESSMRPAGLPPPAGVQHCVDNLAKFAYARCASPSTDSTIDLVVNKAFQERVCSVEALKACWDTNESEMLSLFLHKEDLSILPRETGAFLSRVVVQLQGVFNSPQPAVHPVQRVVRLLVDGEYVACQATIKACSVEGVIYFGFFLSPVAAPPSQADASYALLDLVQASQQHGYAQGGGGSSTQGESEAEWDMRSSGGATEGPSSQGDRPTVAAAPVVASAMDLASTNDLMACFDVLGW